MWCVEKVPERIRVEPVAPEVHEYVSPPEPQPEIQHEPATPEADTVEHKQAVEPLQIQPENELENGVEPAQQPEMNVESIPQPESGIEPEQQPEMNVESIPQPESGIEPEQQLESNMEPLPQPEMNMETAQPQENCIDSTQPEQTIVATSDPPKPRSSVSFESFNSLFLSVPFSHTYDQ